MRRGGYSRFQDRQSYKPSEVLGLFVISIFFGMGMFGICMAVSLIIDRLLGR